MRLNELTPEQVLRYFEARLPGKVMRGGRADEYRAPCPFPNHDDKNPSFGFNTAKRVWHCFVCGGGSLLDFECRLMKVDEQEALQNIAELAGISQKLLAFRGQTPVATYRYTDENGKVLYEKLRYQPKRFLFRRLDDEGRQVYSLEKSVRRVPYHLPDLVTANEVIYVEGEKDADRVRDLHLEQFDSTGKCRLAVTTSGSAKDWRKEFAPQFAGKKVIIIPDDDEPGQKHALQVAQQICPYTNSIKIVKLPAEFKDISDYLDAGHTGEELLQAINATPPWKPEEQQGLGVLLSEIEPESVEWLWPGYIPRGKITILEGDPGLGKSTITVDIAARITKGAPMPLSEHSNKPGGVVLLTAEDGLADTVRPRLDAAGGDASKVLTLSMIQGEVGGERLVVIPSDIALLEQAIAQVKADLVIVDPLVAFLGANVDSYKDHDVRGALAPLAKLAERTGVAVLIVRHLSKAEDKRPINRGAGSIAFGAAARSVLVVGRDHNDSERMVLASVKSNLAACPASLEYIIQQKGQAGSRIGWISESAYTAETLLRRPKGARGAKREEATDFLLEALAAGPMEGKKLVAMAQMAGISEKTLRRAADQLNISTKPKGFRGKWTWQLSDTATVGQSEPRGKTGTDDQLLEECTATEQE